MTAPKGKVSRVFLVCVSVALIQTEIKTKRGYCNRKFPAAVRTVFRQVFAHLDCYGRVPPPIPPPPPLPRSPLKWLNDCCLLVAYVPATCKCTSETDLHNFTRCHTEIEVADPTFYLTQSHYTDTGPTSPSADPGAWLGSHWSANF